MPMIGRDDDPEIVSLCKKVSDLSPLTSATAREEER